MIDQFEELFTLCRSESERTAFLDNLMNAAGRGVLVVMVLRADFYAHCARYPSLREALAARQEYIGPMSASELRQAIEEPARLGGWELAAGLVNLILRDVGASEEHPPEPGALPLLEHALLETWQRRSGRILTLPGYAASGGVQGAIAHTAESVYQGLTGEQQALTRKIFLRLTELGEGTQDTRRRVSLSELAAGTGEASEVESLLKELADARLITLAEGTAEVAHEALIREWPALRGWLNEDRESLRLHRRLTEAAQEWEKLSRDNGELYRGARLAQAVEWAALPSHAGELNALERDFLSNSQEMAEREVREREAQRQRELEATQKLAETEHRSARRLRRRAIYLAGAAALAAILMVAAVLIAMAANRSANQATARQHASAALADLAIDPGQSISQALQGLQVDPSVEAYSALHQALFANHLRSRLDAGQGEVYGMAVSPDGTRLATIGTDQVLKIWQVNGTTIEQPALLTIPNVGLDEPQLKKISLPVYYPLVFSPDGRYLAVSINSDFGKILLFDPRSGKLVRQMDFSTTDMAGNLDITSMAFSPDNHWLAAQSGWSVEIFDVESGSLINWQQVHGGGLTLVYRPDGTLMTAGWDGLSNGEIQLLNLTPEYEILSSKWMTTFLAEKPGDPVDIISLSPDSSQVVYTTAAEGYILDLTPLASGKPPVETVTFPLESDLTNIFYLPGGERLAGADSKGRVTVWDAKNGQPLFRLYPELPLTSAAVSPVSQVLFTGHEDGEICTWDVATSGSPEWLAVPTGGVRSGIVLSPDGADLLSWNLTNPVFGKWEFARWHIADRQVLPLAEFTAETRINPSNNYIFHFGPARIAVGDNYSMGDVRIQNASTGDLIREFAPGPGISDFTLNLDGSRIYFARSYGMVDVWDVDSAQQLNSFRVTPDKALDHPVYLQLSGDDTRLLTWRTDDPVLRLWNPVSGQLIQEFTLTSSPICGPVLTPDNRFLVTCGDEQTALVWEVADGQAGAAASRCQVILCRCRSARTVATWLSVSIHPKLRCSILPAGASCPSFQVHQPSSINR